MITGLDVLKCARTLIAKPEGWTTEFLARVSPKGTRISYLLEEATCFCALGGIARAVHNLGVELGGSGYVSHGEACKELAKSIQPGSAGAGSDGRIIEFWNDAPGRTQAEVVAMFDTTIARLETVGGLRV